VFTDLGFKNVQWVALAGDPIMYKSGGEAALSYSSDISFVGSWRPERERVMSAICRRFSKYKIEIHGNNWKRDSKDPEIRKRVVSKGLFEEAMADKFARTRININVIDDTNYPAANMRFFEIPINGGLEITSSTPEMQRFFKDKEHVIYYDNDQDVAEKIEWALSNPDICEEIRRNGYELASTEHTYMERLKKILESLQRETMNVT
jgi:spore maturation protein CgeB